MINVNHIDLMLVFLSTISIYCSSYANITQILKSFGEKYIPVKNGPKNLRISYNVKLA